MAGYDYPTNIRISCGFSGRGVRENRNGKILGVAYHHCVSSDNSAELFISPELDSSFTVGAVVVHELIHAILPNAGHGKEFKELATKMHLKGKMTSTVADNELITILAGIIETIGEYPHRKMNLKDRQKQLTRLHKLECPICGAIAYMTLKWLENSECGAPICGCTGKVRMERKS